MGQLFNRINRVVRANLNNSEREDLNNNTGDGAAFVAGGTAAGAGVSATVGGMGLVAAGTGVGIGMAPVAAAGAVAGADLKSQFAMLESGSDVDDELAAMKAQLTGRSVSQQALPASQQKKSSPGDLAVDAELEALRKQIDQL